MKYLAPLLVLFILPAALARAAEPSARRPNFVLFLIDDQDYQSIACYGGKTYTPNLDRMAAEGMRFTRAHASSTVCTPSRYGFLTGRYAGASTSKLYDQACGGPGRQGFPNFNMAPEPDRLNVARVLRDAGYVTGFTGKFHLESRPDFPAFYAGPDGFKPLARDAAASPETAAVFAHNERVARRYVENLGFTWAKHVYRENMDKPYHSHNPEWTVAAAVEFIEANKDKPFYLHVCPTLLHGADGSWRRSMDDPLSSGAGPLAGPPTSGMTPRAELLARMKKAGFDPNGSAAGEAWLDDAVGAVLAKLKQAGVDRDTLVVFAPDHGSNDKGSMFAADGTRIPMIARWPGRVPAATTCDALVQNVDWVPTAFAAAAAAVPSGYRVDGRSLLPLFDHNGQEPDGGKTNGGKTNGGKTTGGKTVAGGAAGGGGWRDHLYFEMGHARAVATPDWKYIAIRYPQEAIADIKRSSPEQLPKRLSYLGRLGIGVRGADHPGFWDADQLYDLNADPGERINLAADPAHAARLTAMRSLLAADVKSVGRPFGEFLAGGNAAPPGQVDEQIARVKTLKVQGKTVGDPAAGRPDAPPPPRKKKRPAAPQA